MKNEAFVSVLKEAALEAGDAIMDVYNSMEFGIEYKSDRSPLTLADKAAHEIIKTSLASTNLPLLSEEEVQPAYELRSQWPRFWMVDPLDGTKEFVKRNKDFTVNIALIEAGKPVMGIVYAPALSALYWTDENGSAWKQDSGGRTEPIHTRKRVPIQTIVASKSHLSKETDEYIKSYPGISLQTIGSSLKFMLIAEGAADCYPRFGPTMEWDTAAAQAIVEAAGGTVVQYQSNQPLSYNKENLLNPWFIVHA